MKQFYFLFFVLAVGVSVMATASDFQMINRTPKPCEIASIQEPQGVKASYSAASERIEITDMEKQVRGRYSCVYYSPLIWEETGKPFGWCVEQPLFVEDYFAVEEGDINIGYLFIAKAILKGHVDMAAGTLTVPSRKTITYYEDPDDYSDPGMPVYFVTVDVVNGKYVPNYDRPFVGNFELHDGVITKITTDDRWGYVVCDNDKDRNVVGWFEVAENAVFYLGHGEMEYQSGGKTQATVIHAISDGKKAKIYNAFNTGWDKPITVEINGSAKTAAIREQSVSFGGKTVFLADKSFATDFSGVIRDVDWDIDRRDASENSVLDFGEMALYDRDAKASVGSYGNVRFFFKENVADDSTSGIEDITITDDVDAAPSEAIMYNLSGVRVSNDDPAPGIYIRRSGTKSTKVIIR